MDRKTLEIVQPTEAQLRSDPDRYVWLPEDEVNHVKMMTKNQRLDWLERRRFNRRQRRAEASKKRKSKSKV
jgi:hypothetical protein